jgi:hypothetical protein
MNTVQKPEEKTVGGLVPLCKNLAAIRVLAISPKVVDQLPWRHNREEFGGKFDWTGKELVGRLVPTGLIVRDPTTNQLFKVGEVSFIEARARFITSEPWWQGIR